MNELQYRVLRAIYDHTTSARSYVPYAVFSSQVPSCPSAFDLLSLLPPESFHSQKDHSHGTMQDTFWISPEGIAAIGAYETEKGFRSAMLDGLEAERQLRQKADEEEHRFTLKWNRINLAVALSGVLFGLAGFLVALLK